MGTGPGKLEDPARGAASPGRGHATTVMRRAFKRTHRRRATVRGWGGRPRSGVAEPGYTVGAIWSGAFKSNPGTPPWGGARETSVPTEQPQAGQASRLSAPDVDPGGSGDPVSSAAQGAGPAVSLNGLEFSGRGMAVAPLVALRGKRAFAQLREQGRTVRRGAVWVRAVVEPVRSEGEPAISAVSSTSSDARQSVAVAYAIGRRVGSAVVRNRVRRRLRAIIRDCVPELQPGAYLVGGSVEIASLSYGELKSMVCAAVAAFASPSGQVGASARQVERP